MRAPEAGPRAAEQRWRGLRRGVSARAWWPPPEGVSGTAVPFPSDVGAGAGAGAAALSTRQRQAARVEVC